MQEHIPVKSYIRLLSPLLLDSMPTINLQVWSTYLFIYFLVINVFIDVFSWPCGFNVWITLWAFKSHFYLDKVSALCHSRIINTRNCCRHWKPLHFGECVLMCIDKIFTPASLLWSVPGNKQLKWTLGNVQRLNHSTNAVYWLIDSFVHSFSFMQNTHNQIFLHLPWWIHILKINLSKFKISCTSNHHCSGKKG